MEKLKETEKFILYKKGDDLEKFLRSLVIWQEEFYSETTKRINWLLNRVSGAAVELVKPGNLVGADGNAKIVIDNSGDVLIQIKVSGTWTDTGWKLKGS